MNRSERGVSALVLLILVFGLITVPAYIWHSGNSSKNLQNKDVQGASVVGGLSTKPGFSVSVKSSSSTWDLLEYLCVSVDECTNTLNSGRRLGTVSGGKTDLHEVVVEYSPEWDSYDYVKYFVKSGWYASGDVFEITDIGNVPGSAKYEISEDGSLYDVVLTPVSSVQDNFYTSATFSDL